MCYRDTSGGTMQEREPFRTRLEGGEVAVGAVARTPTPTLVEVYGDVGLDFVFLDYEHAGGPSPEDTRTLENLVRAAELTGIEPLVRIPEGHPPLVRKVLETGVRTLLVPRVEAAAEVREAVAATRFSFDGGVGDAGSPAPGPTAGAATTRATTAARTPRRRWA